MDGETHENELQYTFTGTGKKMSSSRIDRIYCTPSLFQKCSDWKIHDKPLFTDHSDVSVDVSPRAQVAMGKGLWRMNVRRFDNPKFREPVKVALKQGLKSISRLWEKNGETFSPTSADVAPATLTLFTNMIDQIGIGAKKAQRDLARANGRCILKYQRKVRWLQGQRRTRKTIGKLRMASSRLRSMEIKDKEDREILVKAKAIEVGPGDPEFWAERDVVMSDRAIRGLRGSNDKITRKSSKMLRIAKDFYINLFSRAKTNPKSQDVLVARLPSGNFAGLEGPVSIGEVSAVVSKWKNGKTPGVDGIPQDFYKKFRDYKRRNSFSFIEVVTIICMILIETTKYN